MTEFILHIKNNEILNKVKTREAFTLEDGSYRVRISLYKRRSNLQNSYYFGAVLPIVLEGLRHNGYNEIKTVEDAHEVLKHLFLKKNIVHPETGELITTIAGSTADLTTAEFVAYIDEIVQWAAQYLSCTIPGPGEQSVIFAEYDSTVNATIIKK